jgi:hypothetical protein
MYPIFSKKEFGPPIGFVDSRYGEEAQTPGKVFSIVFRIPYTLRCVHFGMWHYHLEKTTPRDENFDWKARAREAHKNRDRNWYGGRLQCGSSHYKYMRIPFTKRAFMIGWFNYSFYQLYDDSED